MTEKTTTEKSAKSFRIPGWLVLGAAYYFLVRPRLQRWGTQFNEQERELAGDHLILHPNSQFTHAIDIHAPRRAVWGWLSQMGRGGTGFYNIDALSNNGTPSANYLRRDLPPLETGMRWDNGLKVLQMETQQDLVVGDFSRPHLVLGNYDMTYAYHLQERTEQTTRLIVRMRVLAPDPNGILFNLFREPVDYLQSINQLNNLRQLSEASKHLFEAQKEKSNGRLKV